MGILAEIFKDKLEMYLGAHNPTRVLIGGLPDFIIDEIAKAWTAKIQLLLVRAGVSPLPANVQLCRPDDLTAERQHGWAALVSVHESRGIQESIRSAGAGTVRELWAAGFPWNPCELPGVRWNDVKEEIIIRLGLVNISRHVSVLLDQYLEELLGEIDASDRFYSSLNALHQSGIQYEDLCFQLGFPSHQAGKELRKRGDPETVLPLLDRFLEVFKEETVDEATEQFQEAANTLYAADVKIKASIDAALQFFAAGFRNLSSSDLGNSVLTWRTVFAGNRSHWETLSAEVISSLIGSDNQRPSISELVLTSGSGIQLFDIGENHIIVRDRNVSTPTVTASFEFGRTLLDQADNAASTGNIWRLYSRVNRAYTRLADPLLKGKGPHSKTVLLPNEGKQTVLLLVGPDTSTERAASKVVTLWECCQDTPFFITSTHSKLRPGKRRRSKDETGNIRYEIEQEILLPAQGRISLHGFVYGMHGNLSAVLPNETGPNTVEGIKPVPNSLCHQFTLNVEVTEVAEITFNWADSSGTAYRAIVAFEIEGESGPRDDSMTGVILRAHSRGKNKEIKNQLGEIKSGKKLICGELPIKETSKPISVWEQYQQESTKGWWPILASAVKQISEQRINPKPASYFHASSSIQLNEQANAWMNLVSSAPDINPIPPPVAAYVSARTAVINELGSQFTESQDEEITGINLARKSSIGLIKKEVLKIYIQAYTDLLKASNDSSFPNSWKWIAWCLDSVLLFGLNSTGPTAHLLGPFHPVTISRLFFLQNCLIERLIGDEMSPLAHVLAQVQPLALGHVLDAQLQPSPAIAFPTGEYHWLWLYRQQGQSDLPGQALVEWMRKAGLDPQTGPLAVDSEILPQTIRQYILAYPSHQTLRLCLEDCTQRTFEVLREEFLPSSDFRVKEEGLGLKLLGGIAVYDPLTKVKRLDGELILHDPDLPIRWHHCKPPQSLTIDIATLPRSSRVDFQSGLRGGSFSSCVPTARRGMLEYGSAGLEVSTAIINKKEILSDIDLENATADLLALFEPEKMQLSWGTSLSMTGGPKANWTLCSASQVDPRLFIEYVKRNPETALWTYRLYSVSENNSPEFGRGHYLIARVSHSLASGIQAQLSATGFAITPSDLLAELAQAGLTLGDEFLRTGRTAEGAIGQYLVQRLVWQPAGDKSPLPHWEVDQSGLLYSAGSLLQIDPFSKVLEALAGAGQVITDGEAINQRKRSDLVSIQLKLCGDELWLKPVVFESKYISGNQLDLENATKQAFTTATQIDRLLEFCLHDSTKPHDAFWAQPERLLLAEMIHLGLRLACGSFPGSADEWHVFERLVLSKILSGEFRRKDAQAITIIHYPGPTIDSLKSDSAHAFISFSDASSAQAGKPSTEYLNLQKALAGIVRHECGQKSSQGLIQDLSRTDEKNIQMTSSLKNVPNKITITYKEETSINQTPVHEPAFKEAEEKTEKIKQAHKAFDLAFADFIGNKQAIEKLRDDLVDALIKRPPFLPSAYLLTGNPSTGKTTLANKIAKLLDVTFVKLVGTNIRSEADLVEQVDNAFQAAGIEVISTQSGSQGLPEREYPECLIFIDEIHLVTGRAQEGLLTLTEPNDRYIRLRDRICRFPRATYIAATTRDSEIDRALRTRFGNPIHLRDYSIQEVAKMLAVKEGNWRQWPETILCGVAQLARCIPREAERLVQKLHRKMEVSREKLSLEGALEKLRIEEGLDRNGLDQVCWTTLRHLAKQSRPLGRDTLAQQIGLSDQDQLISEKIPALQALGLVEQVAGGQRITDRGRNYLRNESPPVII